MALMTSRRRTSSRVPSGPVVVSRFCLSTNVIASHWATQSWRTPNSPAREGRPHGVAVLPGQALFLRQFAPRGLLLSRAVDVAVNSRSLFFGTRSAFHSTPPSPTLRGAIQRPHRPPATRLQPRPLVVDRS